MCFVRLRSSFRDTSMMKILGLPYVKTIYIETWEDVYYRKWKFVKRMEHIYKEHKNSALR
jgi:hypothetical protein